MKKLLTLLLVFSFAYSFSTVKYVPEKKAEKFLIEKSTLKTDVISTTMESPVKSSIFVVNSVQKDYFYQHRFNENSLTMYAKAKFISRYKPINYNFDCKLPDKNTQ